MYRNNYLPVVSGEFNIATCKYCNICWLWFCNSVKCDRRECITSSGTSTCCSSALTSLNRALTLEAYDSDANSGSNPTNWSSCVVGARVRKFRRISLFWSSTATIWEYKLSIISSDVSWSCFTAAVEWDGATLEGDDISGELKDPCDVFDITVFKCCEICLLCVPNLVMVLCNTMSGGCRRSFRRGSLSDADRLPRTCLKRSASANHIYSYNHS